MLGLISSPIHLTQLQHIPPIRCHHPDPFLLLCRWQMHGEDVAGDARGETLQQMQEGRCKGKALSRELMTTQHPPGKAAAEKMSHFSCFYSQSATPKQRSA